MIEWCKINRDKPIVDLKLLSDNCLKLEGLNWNIVTGCEIYGFVSGLSGTLSIMTLAAIAIDRYFVLVNPLSMARKTTHRKAIVTIALLWIYSGFFASLPLVGVGKYVPEGYLTSCSFDYLSEDATDRVFIFSFFIAAWLLPFTILAFCYISIVASVSSMRKDLASHKNSSSSRSSNFFFSQFTTILMILSPYKWKKMCLYCNKWKHDHHSRQQFD